MLNVFPLLCPPRVQVCACHLILYPFRNNGGAFIFCCCRCCFFLNIFIIAWPGPLPAGQINDCASLCLFLSGDRLPEKHCKYTKHVFFSFIFYPLPPLAFHAFLTRCSHYVHRQYAFFFFFTTCTSQLLTNTFCFSVPRS